MTVNDGKGLFDKYGLIGEMQKKLDVMADAKGVLRAGLTWDVYQMLSALQEGLKKEDAETKEAMQGLKKASEELVKELRVES